MDQSYLISVIWYLCWPALIFITLGLILLTLKFFEKKMNLHK